MHFFPFKTDALRTITLLPTGGQDRQTNDPITGFTTNALTAKSQRLKCEFKNLGILYDNLKQIVLTILKTCKMELETGMRMTHSASEFK